MLHEELPLAKGAKEKCQSRSYLALLLIPFVNHYICEIQICQRRKMSCLETLKVKYLFFPQDNTTKSID